MLINIISMLFLSLCILNNVNSIASISVRSSFTEMGFTELLALFFYLCNLVSQRVAFYQKIYGIFLLSSNSDEDAWLCYDNFNMLYERNIDLWYMLCTCWDREQPGTAQYQLFSEDKRLIHKTSSPSASTLKHNAVYSPNSLWKMNIVSVIFWYYCLTFRLMVWILDFLLLLTVNDTLVLLEFLVFFFFLFVLSSKRHDPV